MAEVAALSAACVRQDVLGQERQATAATKVASSTNDRASSGCATALRRSHTQASRDARGSRRRWRAPGRLLFAFSPHSTMPMTNGSKAGPCARSARRKGATGGRRHVQRGAGSTQRPVFWSRRPARPGLLHGQPALSLTENWRTRRSRNTTSRLRAGCHPRRLPLRLDCRIRHQKFTVNRDRRAPDRRVRHFTGGCEQANPAATGAPVAPAVPRRLRPSPQPTGADPALQPEA